MHHETHGLALHMQDLGLIMLGHAVHHSIFADRENPYYNAIGVLHAAQAAEIVLKACIAEQHPLLIFARLPKPENDDESPVTLNALMTQGRTLQYAELPDVFWAATGFRVPAIRTYRMFGDLRNTIQHLGVPDEDLTARTLEFLLDVVDPTLQEFWATNIFRHLQADEEEHFREALESRDIRYRGWAPMEHDSLGPGNPLWLFRPWEHSETNERIWVDDHVGGQLKILKAQDYVRHLKNHTEPTQWSSNWRDVFPSKREGARQAPPSD